MNVLKLENISKTFLNGPEILHILKGVSFSVKAKETLIITGESGCGKSTLLNLIGGLDLPSEGHIFAGNTEINNLSEIEQTAYRSRVIGFIFQFHYLLKDFTAVENVMLPAFMAGKSKKAALKSASSLLDQVNIGDREGHYPSQLSGGERQRVAVARALINNPDIILADEPTGNLDEANSRIVEDLLFELVEKHGKTLILVTHDTHLSRKGNRHLELFEGVIKEV